MKYEVTLVLPKNRRVLEDAYTKVMVDIATEIINNYKAPTVLVNEIVQANNQMSFKEVM